MQHKEELLVLRVLPSDKLVLRHMAEAEGEAMAVIVRRLIRRAAQEQGFWPTKHPAEKAKRRE